MDHSHMDMDMDMEEPSGLPWLDSPVMLHSNRADTCKLTAEQCAYRNGHWRYWYEADHVYALNTVYFLCATVGVFTIFHFTERYAPDRLRRNALWQKGTAASRFLAYRGVRLPVIGYWAASLGMVALISIGIIFFFAMTLGPRPYYWPNTDEVSYGGSPPLATRAGWMAVALLPFVLVLGSKANVISALTGVPHERLQVFHHWTSYAMFVLALVHTFPFIVNNISEGQMMSEWRTSMFYWTGVAALLPQAYLTFMSLPSIRNRYYEFFKATHFLIALLFILFFFFHCDFRLSSWDYFIAAGSLYLLSLLTSLIRTHLINGRHTATVTLLPSGLLEIKIPTITSWSAGKHVYLRFTNPCGIGLHSLTSHPFTICSTAHDIRGSGKANEMVFYIKPKKGITGRLAAIATKEPGRAHSVLVEGPYGGIDEGVLGRSDGILVISGGSGGGFSLGVFETALKDAMTAVVANGKRSIRVIYAAHTVDVARWYREEIETLLARYGAESKLNIDVDVSIHVTSRSISDAGNNADTDIEKEINPRVIPGSGPTGPTTRSKKASASAEEQGTEPLSDSSLSDARENLNKTGSNHTTRANANANADAFHRGRPDLPSIIANAAQSEGSTATGKRMAIFVCGPASMLHDVRNATATEQEKILKGVAGGEVYLHSESFSW
ncbi:ferric reductase family protein [Aspergillus undulatus]|uniref:ferric reductase family protein n=1 Tax=Aspergillus undulatus TaxID=1810928 RepID=UPI003CCCC1EA